MSIMEQQRTKEDIKVCQDFYVIALTWTNLDNRPMEVYFKTDRYSVYTGNLQVEWKPEDGQQFKTEKGTRAAIDRLLDRGVFKQHHEPRVVRYTVTTTKRWETL